MDYIFENKEWIFSGIGVFVLTIIISYFFKKRERSSNITKIKGTSNVVKQISSDANNEIEIEGDMNNISHS